MGTTASTPGALSASGPVPVVFDRVTGALKSAPPTAATGSALERSWYPQNFGTADGAAERAQFRTPACIVPYRDSFPPNELGVLIGDQSGSDFREWLRFYEFKSQHVRTIRIRVPDVAPAGYGMVDITFRHAYYMCVDTSDASGQTVLVIADDANKIFRFNTKTGLCLCIKAVKLKPTLSDSVTLNGLPLPPHAHAAAPETYEPAYFTRLTSPLASRDGRYVYACDSNYIHRIELLAPYRATTITPPRGQRIELAERSGGGSGAGFVDAEHTELDKQERRPTIVWPHHLAWDMTRGDDDGSTLLVLTGRQLLYRVQLPIPASDARFIYLIASSSTLPHELISIITSYISDDPTVTRIPLVGCWKQSVLDAKLRFEPPPFFATSAPPPLPDTERNKLHVPPIDSIHSLPCGQLVCTYGGYSPHDLLLLDISSGVGTFRELTAANDFERAAVCKPKQPVTGVCVVPEQNAVYVADALGSRIVKVTLPHELFVPIPAPAGMISAAAAELRNC